jgi:hypothetical protein
MNTKYIKIFNLFLILGLFSQNSFAGGLTSSAISGNISTSGSNGVQQVAQGQTTTHDINNSAIVSFAIGAHERVQTKQIVAEQAASFLKNIQDKIVAIQNSKISLIEQKRQVDELRAIENAAIQAVKTTDKELVEAQQVLQKSVDKNNYLAELAKMESANKAQADLLKSQLDTAKTQAATEKAALEASDAAVKNAEKNLAEQKKIDEVTELERAVKEAKEVAAAATSGQGLTEVNFKGSEAAIAKYNETLKKEFEKLNVPSQKQLDNYYSKKNDDELEVSRLNDELKTLKENKEDAIKKGSTGLIFDSQFNILTKSKEALEGKLSNSSPPAKGTNKLPTVISTASKSAIIISAEAVLVKAKEDHENAILKSKESAANVTTLETENRNSEGPSKQITDFKNQVNIIDEAKNILKKEEKKLADEDKKLNGLKNDLKFYNQVALTEANSGLASAIEDKKKADADWKSIQDNKKANEKIFTSQKDLDDVRAADLAKEKTENAAKEKALLNSPEYKKYEADLKSFNDNFEFNESMRKNLINVMKNGSAEEKKKYENWLTTYKPNFPYDESIDGYTSDGLQALQRGVRAYNRALNTTPIPPTKPTPPKAAGTFAVSETKYTIVIDPRIAAQRALDEAKVALKRVNDKIERLKASEINQQNIVDNQKETVDKAKKFVAAIDAAKKPIVARNPTPIMDKPIPDGTELILKVVKAPARPSGKNSGTKTLFLDPIADASKTKNLLNLTSQKQ